MANLREFLSDESMTQAQLAALIGVSRGHMSCLVSGVKSPSLSVAIAIERATDGKVSASSWLSDTQKLPGAAA